MLRITKCVELCGLTKNIDDMLTKSGVQIYQAAKPETKLTLEVLTTTTFGLQEITDMTLQLQKQQTEFFLLI